MKTKTSSVTFNQAVWAATKKIPKGKVATYGVIAKMIRRPKASRAVGNALNKNPYAPQVPCHRVVRSDGSIGGFASGPKKKIALLTKEGVKISNNKVAPLDKFLYTGK
jgi:O-6-methylguanine DNA methyltransferase